MLYQFQCKECEHPHEEIFPASDYEKRVMSDGRLKRKRCEGCGALKVHRYIGIAPAMIGGTKGYMSMERYWAQNPGLKRQQEDRLAKEAQRSKDFKNDAIKRQNSGEKMGPERKDDT